VPGLRERQNQLDRGLRNSTSPAARHDGALPSLDLLSVIGDRDKRRRIRQKSRIARVDADTEAEIERSSLAREIPLVDPMSLIGILYQVELQRVFFVIAAKARAE